jgi:hypothetical protein
MGDTAGPDRHTLDRGRDGGNCVAGSKQALALLLPSRYCCLTIAASSMGSWLLSPLRSRDLPTMKGHRPSASADLSVRANLKPLQTPFDWGRTSRATGYRHGAQPYGSVFSNRFMSSPPRSMLSRLGPTRSLPIRFHGRGLLREIAYRMTGAQWPERRFFLSRCLVYRPTDRGRRRRSRSSAGRRDRLERWPSMGVMARGPCVQAARILQRACAARWRRAASGRTVSLSSDRSFVRVACDKSRMMVPTGTTELVIRYRWVPLQEDRHQ